MTEREEITVSVRFSEESRELLFVIEQGDRDGVLVLDEDEARLLIRWLTRMVGLERADHPGEEKA